VAQQTGRWIELLCRQVADVGPPRRPELYVPQTVLRQHLELRLQFGCDLVTEGADGPGLAHVMLQTSWDMLTLNEGASIRLRDRWCGRDRAVPRARALRGAERQPRGVRRSARGASCRAW